jgi:hypothetical protein
MVDRGPSLAETRVMPVTQIRRERKLPMRGEMFATIGSKLDPLDVIARAIPPRVRRALSLTRVLGVPEADVPKRLLKQAGDTVEAREIIIAKPINFGFQQLVYRSPGPGTIAAIKGSWMVLDLDGLPFDLKALYRGTVAGVTPRFGAVIEGQGALIQGLWGSGKEGYGVLKMMAKTRNDVLEAEPLNEDVRGTILVAGAGVTEEALRRAVSLHAQGLIAGGLDPDLRAVVEELQSCVIVTEGFGRIPMSAPIFELLESLNGQEAAANGLMRMRGGNIRPEIFIPMVGSRPADPSAAKPMTPLTVQPGARVRVNREPYLGRIGRLPQELIMTWTSGKSGMQLPSVEIEFQDARGDLEERALIPWTNIELIG